MLKEEDFGAFKIFNVILFSLRARLIFACAHLMILLSYVCVH